MTSSTVTIFLASFIFGVSANYFNEFANRGACPMNYLTGPDGDCFRFGEDKHNFFEARSSCLREGADLVNAQSSHVYEFIKGHIESNPHRAKVVHGLFHKINKVFTKWSNAWWVGATRKSDGFHWFDDSKVYGHWMQGMPDNGRLFFVHWKKENCLTQMESEAGWDDSSCDKKLRYICQKRASDPCIGHVCGHGTCVATREDQPLCVCRDGWIGSRCNNAVVSDPCRPSPCFHDGRCVVEGSRYRCACGSGIYGGRRCETECRHVVNERGLPRKMDVLFMMDGSTSVTTADFRKSLQFLDTFVEGLEIGEDRARVGLIQFSHDFQQQLDFASSVKMGKTALRRHIAGLRQLSGGTATGRALEFAKGVLTNQARVFSPDTANFLIVLTDGQSHQENIVRSVIPDIEKIGVEILSIGVGRDVDAEELLLIAGGRPNRVFSVASFDQLDVALLREIIDRMCEL